ncbi:MAG: hypothetical protein JSV17_18175 [Candidatus Aminicenantes bacterium]|nr:MAG: hypothetical protein JSV17_18175 [Candidatus Aminicenantes bacterium]
MFTKMHWLFTPTLAVLLILFGCKGKNPTGPEEQSDSISINSVTPNSGLTPGIITAFVVNVEYVLASKDTGELNIGFNTDIVGSYTLLTAAKALVSKGSGAHQFNVTIVTKDWGAAGDFSVYVNLSESPHEPSWTPLATDIRKLTFK